MSHESWAHVSIEALKLEDKITKCLKNGGVLTIGELQDRIAAEELLYDDGGVYGIGPAAEAKINRAIVDFMRDARSPWPLMDGNFFSLLATLGAVTIALWRTGDNLASADEMQILVSIAVGLVSFEIGRWIGWRILSVGSMIRLGFVFAIIGSVVFSKEDIISSNYLWRLSLGVPFFIAYDLCCLILGARRSQIAPNNEIATLNAQFRSVIAMAGCALAQVVICNDWHWGETERLLAMGLLLGAWEWVRLWSGSSKIASLPPLDRSAVARAHEPIRSPVRDPIIFWVKKEFRVFWPLVQMPIYSLVVALIGWCTRQLNADTVEPPDTKKVSQVRPFHEISNTEYVHLESGKWRETDYAGSRR